MDARTTKDKHRKCTASPSRLAAVVEEDEELRKRKESTVCCNKEARKLIVGVKSCSGVIPTLRGKVVTLVRRWSTWRAFSESHFYKELRLREARGVKKSKSVNTSGILPVEREEVGKFDAGGSDEGFRVVGGFGVEDFEGEEESVGERGATGGLSGRSRLV
ncbi:hypothetical protein Ancab_011459 [Ancistrocladus abbreviatus]